MRTLISRFLLTTMVGLFVAVPLAQPAPVQAQSVTSITGAQDQKERWARVKSFLNSIHTREDACELIFGNNENCKSAYVDTGSGGPPVIGGVVDSISNTKKVIIPGNIRLPVRYSTNRYEAAPGSKYKRLSGKNIYLLVSTEDAEDLRLPSDINPNDIRFVLTDVENISKGDLDPGGDEGNVFIFRNEFNPNLVLAFRKEVGGGFKEVAEKHFAFASSCRDTLADDKWISDTATQNDAYDFLLSSAENKEAMQAQIKAQGMRVNVCDTDSGFFATAIRNALSSVGEALGDLINTITGWLSDLMDVGTIADVPGLTNAWKTIRDFVNILFILVLSAVAFSNILRIDTERYGVRALLPRLVFAVIAVNFSLLVVQLLTNVAFILSQPFIEVSRTLITDPPADGSLIDPDEGIGPAAVAIVVLLVLIVAMLVLTFFFLVRILVIWLLAALSPFVFLFMVLPLTRSLASAWWKNTLKWVFMAPIAFVVLFIAAEIISGGRNETVESTQDPSFILKVGFFAGAAIAAVMIPLKLGGEVMGRAASGGRRGLGMGARRLPGARTAMALREQRQANREQGARLRAAGIQGGISRGLSRVPGGRAAAAYLTGGRAGMIGAQAAAIESKYAGDIKSMKLDTGAQRMIARGDTRGLRRAGLHQAANLANSRAGRRAAGQLLAQEGLLNRETALHPDQIAAGNQTLMRPFNPVLGHMNQQGNWEGDDLRALTAQAQSSQADGLKQVHWSDVLESLQHGRPAERHAAERFVQNLQHGALQKNFDPDSRNFIDSDEERLALYDSLRMANHPEAHQYHP